MPEESPLNQNVVSRSMRNIGMKTRWVRYLNLIIATSSMKKCYVYYLGNYPRLHPHIL